jgi:transcriptional regulator with XRE-family HTH domain
LGLKVKKVRELKNIAQSHVAAQLGISQSTYSDLENGKIKISEEKLESISNILGVSPETIRNFNDTVVFNSCAQSGYINTNINNPIEKIHELYEALLKEKDSQILLLKSLLNKDK